MKVFSNSFLENVPKTKEEFISILSKEWKDVSGLLSIGSSKTSLLSICRHLALDAFIRRIDNESTDVLRWYLLFLERDEYVPF